MEVTKRNGSREKVTFDKISARVSKLTERIIDCKVDVPKVAQSVIAGLYDGVHTSELDMLAASTSASFALQHTDYDKLAGLIAVSNLHKETSATFKEAIYDMYHYINPKTNKPAPLITKDVFDVVYTNQSFFENAVQYNRDYQFTYFGFKTLERSYLLKINGKIVERPQYMYMRVAIGIHGTDLERVVETYDLLSMGILSHASPTMFSAGTLSAQLSSCFLLTIQEDSINGIYNTLSDCANISKGMHFFTCPTMWPSLLITWINGVFIGLVLPFAIVGIGNEFDLFKVCTNLHYIRTALIVCVVLLLLFCS
jgi:hypothetical protein